MSVIILAVLLSPLLVHKIGKQIFFIILLLVITVPPKFNNTCKNYAAYLNIFFSSDCYYDPDVEDDVFGIIRRHIGVSELHQIETEDNYILSVIRIPNEKPKGSIIFVHPVSTDARVWVSQQNNSVAFLFWRAGYDIWLVNARGTFYSKKHRTLEPSDAAFWKFSFHEIGYYDIHAVTTYVKMKADGSKIILMGLSMGATTGLVYASTRPDVAADTLSMIVAIAPGFYLKELTSPMRTIIPFLLRLRHKLDLTEAISSVGDPDTFSIQLLRTISALVPFKKIFAYALVALNGGSPDEIDPSLLNAFLNTVAECSVSIYVHYVQNFAKHDVRFFDYGEKENLEKYGDGVPPLYPLEDIKLPVFIIYGQNDTLTCPQDVEFLYENLPAPAKIYGKMLIPGYGHVDFFIGKRRNEVYDGILALLDQV